MLAALSGFIFWLVTLSSDGVHSATSHAFLTVICPCGTVMILLQEYLQPSVESFQFKSQQIRQWEDVAPWGFVVCMSLKLTQTTGAFLLWKTSVLYAVCLTVTALPAAKTFRFREIYYFSLRLCHRLVSFLICRDAWEGLDKLLPPLDSEVNLMQGF